jgi:competence protein ComEA
VGLVAVLAIVVLGVLWFGRSTPDPAGAPAVDLGGVDVAPGGLTVHVSGEVASPGLVALPTGARVADAVAAAGGTLPAADLASLNLAAPVRDGEHVAIISRSSELSDQGATVPAGAVDDGRVHVNRATAAELEVLPGVGPVLAGRIAAHRDEHGAFTAVEDLLDVAGIGEAKLAAMRDVVALP